MKLLIAYDGSPFSDLMLGELEDMGLPVETDATVLSVAERWFPAAGTATQVEEEVAGHRAAAAIAEHACSILASSFPSWTIRAEAATGSPAQQIMERADHWKADLVVLGALGRTALERILIGSVSSKVANEARCSVRICRNLRTRRREPRRIVVGYDGMPGSDAAIRAVAARAWPGGASVRLVTAVGFGYSPVAQLMLTEDYHRARQIQGPAEAALRTAGLDVSTVVIEDDPKIRIIEEAGAFAADSIFIGHNDRRLAYRLFLGTVASAIVSRAKCSVEIVRAGNHDSSLDSDCP